LAEEWQKVSIGLLLKDIDTILTGEDAEVALKFENGETFTLGSNAILDVGDLRKIQEKELFLYLMSKKIEKIESRKYKTRLRVGDVSVVHGESKADKESVKAEKSQPDWAVREVNGALSLYIQEYYTNTIIKLHKILAKYESAIDYAKIYFYIGKAFEAINKNGQAIDAYQTVIDIYQNQNDMTDDTKKWIDESQLAIKRLNH